MSALMPNHPTYGLTAKMPYPMIYFSLTKARTVKSLDRDWGVSTHSKIVQLLTRANPSSLSVFHDFLLSKNLLHHNYDDSNMNSLPS